MQLGGLIGRGGACDVYAIDGAKVVKLYFHGYSKNSVEWEYNKTQDAYKKGLPAPEVFEIVEHEGRFGLVMEKIKGRTLMEIMASHIAMHSDCNFESLFASPEIEGNIKLSACMLHELHTLNATLSDTAQNSLMRALDRTKVLEADEKGSIRTKINNLPNSSTVCHGDPNPGNIIKTNDGHRWIDWVNAVTGHPFYDLVYFVLMMKYLEFDAGTPALFAKFVLEYADKITEVFLNEYKLVSCMTLDGLDDWIIPVCVCKDRFHLFGEIVGADSISARMELNNVILDIAGGYGIRPYFRKTPHDYAIRIAIYASSQILANGDYFLAKKLLGRNFYVKKEGIRKTMANYQNGRNCVL